MLDVITSGAAVFEPEEVDVLTAAFNLAIKKVDRDDRADEAMRSEVARLVHNLGRSRLKLKKRLRDAADAATLAEEAADLAAYLRQAPPSDPDAITPSAPTRAVPIFPAEFRNPPTSVLRPHSAALAKPQREGSRPSARRTFNGDRSVTRSRPRTPR